MGKSENRPVQVIISQGGGLVTDVQVFQSETSAQQFWDASIEEAKKHVEYEKLPPEHRQEFDQDPFGYAYGEDLDLIWEKATVRD